MPRNYAKKKKSHKAAMITILCVVVFLCCITEISNRDKQKELEKDKKTIEQLQELIEDEKNRNAELEELRVYVRTMKYVEEKARELGLVYPDEIIYKPK